MYFITLFFIRWRGFVSAVPQAFGLQIARLFIIGVNLR